MKKLTFYIVIALLPSLISACEAGLEPVPFQGISGDVAFVGELPDSTDWVRVAAFVDLPRTEIELLNFAAISNELILLGDSTKYVLDLDTDLYHWLPVVWKRSDALLTPDALRILGWYTAGGDPFDSPRLFGVESDKETTGINLIADFENAMTVEEALEAIQ